MSVNDVFTYTGVSGTGVKNFTLRGGAYSVSAAASGWGTVALEVLAADGTTYVPYASFDANTAADFNLTAGSYQFAYGSLTGGSLSIAQQPNPGWQPLASLPVPITSSAGVTTYGAAGSDSDVTVTSDTNLTLHGNSLVLDGPILRTGDGQIYTDGTVGFDMEVANVDSTGSAGTSAKGIYMQAGFCDTLGTGGAFFFQSGDGGSSGGDGGLMGMQGGGSHASGATGGECHIVGGQSQASGAHGGAILIQSGQGLGNGHSGNITIQTGTVEAGTRGNIIITGLPTSASGLPTGALWNNSGTLKIV